MKNYNSKNFSIDEDKEYYIGEELCDAVMLGNRYAEWRYEELLLWMKVKR
jgi:hypothetical protein